ncbi:Hsp20/alpha crystallin family protein [Inediibacterium massiliense]|uniref:Hsp20/alpha crystallin family protein n=1 Tax=Inediibacterium massiliense TaxID=1658111 RepID=UPI0006B53BAF|nr:Hsp20/alpha crystallin family protein [Inediibacterium massiliense]
MFGMTPFNRKNQMLRRNYDLFNMENFFEDFFTHSFFAPMNTTMGQMKVDIKEKENEYIVEAELPGVNKEEIHIDLKDDRLTISVEKNEVTNEEKENYIRKERKYGSMMRNFYIENVEPEKVAAQFNNGILSICLPKKEASQIKGKKIDIQ